MTLPVKVRKVAATRTVIGKPLRKKSAVLGAPVKSTPSASEAGSRKGPGLDVPATLFEPAWPTPVATSARGGYARQAWPEMPRTLFENDPVPPKVVPTARLASPPPAPLADGEPASVASRPDNSGGAQPESPRVPTAVAGTAPAADPTATATPLPEVKLWLAARDSFTMVAYWNPPAGQLDVLSSGWGAGVWQLRVWLAAVNPAVNPEVTLELNAHPAATHRFLPVLHPGQPYVAELGHLAAGGQWHSVARSAAFATPPDRGGYEAHPPEFRALAPLVAAAPGTGVAALGTVGSTATGKGTRGRGRAAGDAPGRPATEQRTRWVQEAFYRQSPGSSAEVVHGQRQITETTTRVFPGENDEALERSLGAAVNDLPSSEATVPPPPAQARGFWFEVNAELIVHGRTERGAAVTLGGRPVKLRGDGSFTFRFALPDGDFSLPAVAVSAAQDDQRSAALRFIRSTVYDGVVGTHPIAPELRPPTPEAVVNPAPDA